MKVLVWLFERRRKDIVAAFLHDLCANVCVLVCLCLCFHSLSRGLLVGMELADQLASADMANALQTSDND